MGIGSATIQNFEIGDNTVVFVQSMVARSMAADKRVAAVPANII